MAKQNILESSGLELFTRVGVSQLLKMSLASVDLIPEKELPRVRIGKSVRFTQESIREFIKRHEMKIKGRHVC
jgi:predicted DNA-binding transcriptional regulator AlpA